MPRIRLSLLQRRQIAAWFEIGKTVSQIQSLFRRQFGVRCQVPIRKIILSIGEKFQEKGSVKERKRSGRRVSATCEENIVIVHGTVINCPNKRKTPGISDTNSSGSSFELQKTADVL
ncbi:hypothetical protein C0J52_10096 [Blattella germanica]|nr:hypothetical protein C0J52_10096 [Blattella germanica]